MNPIAFCEIPVRDLDRACRFYEAVFELKLERITVDGNEMAMFPAREGAAGANAALAKGETYVPSHQGSVVYFGVTDIRHTVARAISAGGRSLYPFTAIGEYGFVAEFEDSEGNRIALHQPPAQTK